MFEPDKMQRLLLWMLATKPDGEWLKDLPSHIVEKSKRDPLIRAGLIEEEKKRLEIPGKRATKPLFLTLSDAGWLWLSEHLTLDVSRSNYAADVLNSFLKMLKTHLDQHQVALADFVSGAELPEENAAEQRAFEDAAADPASLADRIRDTYRRLSGNVSNARVRLADLRRELSDVPRAGLDEQLQEMEREGGLVLNRMDDPREIAADDETAKILTPLGDPRHLVHMELSRHA